jgi:hypothetical protein
MQVTRPAISAALAIAFTAAAASAQQQAPRRYTTVSYINVAAGKAGAFQEYYTTGDGAKLVRAQMKANPKILSWSLRRQMFGGNPAPEADHVIMMAWEGAPTTMDPAKRDELYKAAIGMTYAQHQEKLAGLRHVVGSTIAHVHDTVGQSEQGDFVVAQRYKTAPGRSDELSALMHDFRMPMVADRIKGGGALKFWAYAHLALSAGSSEPWDSTITRGFKTLDGALGAGGGAGNPNGAATHFAKLFPTKSYTAYQDGFREYAKLIRTDVYRITVLIRP